MTRRGAAAEPWPPSEPRLTMMTASAVWEDNALKGSLASEDMAIRAPSASSTSRENTASSHDTAESDLQRAMHSGTDSSNPRASLSWTKKQGGALWRRADSANLAEYANHYQEKAQVFTKTAFSAYITGQNNPDPDKADNRSHIMHSWRRAPLVNHNYDATGEPFVFSPDSKVLMIWELFIILCVVWTLIMAPFEIAIIEIHCVVAGIDWIVTLIFLLDLVRYFFTAFEHRGVSGVRMVFDTNEIKKRYCRTWLGIDVLCAAPLDSLNTWFHVSSQSVSGAQTPLQVLRLLRLVRIVKLQRAHMLSRMDLPYTAMTVLKCVVMSLTCAHWLSCIWAALSFMQGANYPTWLDALVRDKLDLNQDVKQEPMIVYMWSLYYSTSLITTVGFGDVTPQTDLECGICTMGIVLGSMLWAYILSSLLDVLNRMNPHRMDFERTIDELNRMMQDHSLPDALRHDVRHYFYECQDLWKLQRRGALIQRMSRSLKGRVTLALNGEWIEKVSYIRGLFIQGISGSTAFVVEISRKMVPKIFSPGEKLATPVLYIVRKGLIASGFRLLGVGDVCGEDLILSNPQNRSPFGLVALTMCGTLALSRSNFLASLEKFPPQRKLVRNFTMWMALKRGLARELRKEASKNNLNGQKTVTFSRPCFFRTMSEGFAMEDQLLGHDEDFEPQVATVADLNAAVRNIEALMEKQRLTLTNMINTHMLRRWQDVEPTTATPRCSSQDGNGYERFEVIHHGGSMMVTPPPPRSSRPPARGHSAGAPVDRVAGSRSRTERARVAAVLR